MNKTSYKRPYASSLVGPALIKLENIKSTYLLPAVKPASRKAMHKAESTTNVKTKPKIMVPSSMKQTINFSKRPLAPLTSLHEIKTVCKFLQDTPAIKSYRGPMSDPKGAREKPKICKTSRKPPDESVSEKLILRDKPKVIPRRSENRTKIEHVKIKRRSSVQCQIRPKAKIKHTPTLEEFQFLGTIGVGCFGHVKLAKWTTFLDKPCAIKIVPKDYALKLKQVDHLIYEKDLLYNLNHPFIVKWLFFFVNVNSLSTFQDKLNVYFVMEFVSGGELYNVVRKQLKSKLESILFYVAEVAIALEYLHARGIVYRDLKPENVMVDDKGHAKLVDFGFAKRINNNRTKTVCGTPGYLAPEQLKGTEYGLEIDIWAFGVFLFELLAGYNPFEDDNNPTESFSNIRQGTISWPPYMNKVAKEFIKKLLVIEPKDRLPFKKFSLDPLFLGMNWQKLKNTEIIPPYIPNLETPYDTKYFYKYPDSVEVEKKMKERIALFKLPNDLGTTQPPDVFKEF